MKATLVGKSLLALVCLLPACGVQTARNTSLTEHVAAEPKFDHKDLLDVIGRSADNQEIRLPQGVTPKQVEAALNGLHSKLRPHRQNPNQLEADADLENTSNANQKAGLKKLKEGYARRIQSGEIKVKRDAAGRWQIEPGQGQGESRGRGHTEFVGPNERPMSVTPMHPVGDGWWRWSTSYRWWGVVVYANHNFLYYLCRYASWMLSNSGLPGWIKTVLSILACGPHNLDGGSDGASVSITWVGAFWYSA